MCSVRVRPTNRFQRHATDYLDSAQDTLPCLKAADASRATGAGAAVQANWTLRTAWGPCSSAASSQKTYGPFSTGFPSSSRPSHSSVYSPATRVARVTASTSLGIVLARSYHLLSSE